jgi:hypothetical protein
MGFFNPGSEPMEPKAARVVTPAGGRPNNLATRSRSWQLVKSRSSEDWTRPAVAVDPRKRRLLSQTALDFLRLLKHPQVKILFDIVEVLLRDGEVREVRHLLNTFTLTKPIRRG